jgi:hypothetical protein
MDLNREEQQPLEEFFKAKNIRFKNEMLDDVCFSSPLLALFSFPEELSLSFCSRTSKADG